MNRILIGLLVLFMASSPALGDEARGPSQQELFDEPDVLSEFDHAVFNCELFCEEQLDTVYEIEGITLYGREWNLIDEVVPHPDGSVSIGLVDVFEATDSMCQFFGEILVKILGQGKYKLIRLIPDEHGWVPSARNPVDMDWARCLADEQACPSAASFGPGWDPDPFDTHDPPPPRPVVVEKKSSGGGCFIQTIQ